MLLQTNSYIVPKEKRAEHARLLRRFRQTLLRLGCDHFEVYEQVGNNWSSEQAGGRFVQLMRFRDRRQQMAVQAAERNDPSAQALIAEFCELINFPYQQEHGLFAVGFYTGALTSASSRPQQTADDEPGEAEAGGELVPPVAPRAAAPSAPAAPAAQPAPVEAPSPLVAESLPEVLEIHEPAYSAQAPAPFADSGSPDELHPVELDAADLEQPISPERSGVSNGDEFEAAHALDGSPTEEDRANDSNGELDDLLADHFAAEASHGGGNGRRNGNAHPVSHDSTELGQVLDAGLIDDAELDLALPAELIETHDDELALHPGNGRDLPHEGLANKPHHG